VTDPTVRIGDEVEVMDPALKHMWIAKGGEQVLPRNKSLAGEDPGATQHRGQGVEKGAV
jgi:hypothetical protein